MQVALTLRETAYIIETHTHTPLSTKEQNTLNSGLLGKVYIYIYNIDIFANQT